MLKLNTSYFLIAFSVLAVIHIVSLETYLYWRYLWLDIPVHVLGGAVIALLTFVPYDFRDNLPERWLKPIPVIAFVLIAALLWEIYELKIGAFDPEYQLDTVVDLVMGLLGGVIGYFVGKRLYDLKSHV